MYSPRVAYQEGRRIGRALGTVRLDHDQLRAVVNRELRPKIALRKSDEDRASESATALAGLCVVLTLLASGFAASVLLWPDSPVAGLIPPAATPLIGVAAAVLVLLSVTTLVAARRSSQRATDAREARYREILNEGFRGAREVLDTRRDRAGLSVHRASTGLPSGRPTPTFDEHVSPREAEELAAQWMRSLGVADAHVTRYIGDGGIDVESRQFIAQVKHHSTPVGAGAVRELSGVASVDPQRRRALFFSTAGYQPSAVEFADRTLVALFHMIPATGDLRARNDIAANLLQHGLV